MTDAPREVLASYDKKTIREILRFIKWIDRHPVHTAGWVENRRRADRMGMESSRFFRIGSGDIHLMVHASIRDAARDLYERNPGKGHTMYRLTDLGREVLAGRPKESADVESH